MFDFERSTVGFNLGRGGGVGGVNGSSLPGSRFLETLQGVEAGGEGGSVAALQVCLLGASPLG